MKKDRLIHHLSILGFAVFLVLPGFILMYQGERRSISETENRVLTQFPSIYDEDWTTRFNLWYNDHFVLKNEFVALNSRLKYHRLGVSPIPDKISIGKEGWLFCCNGLPYTSVRLSYSVYETELAAIKSTLEHQHRVLKQNGIAFYIAVAPYKARTVGKYLPDYIDSSRYFYNVDFLLDFLEKEVNAPLIDMRKDLESDKHFTKGNIHWNGIGAFIGTQHLIRALKTDFPQLKIPQREEFVIDSLIESSSLDRMMGLYQAETRHYLKAIDTVEIEKLPKRHTLPENYKKDPTHFEQRFLNNQAGNHLKVMFIHDSFIFEMMPYLNRSFEETLYFRRNQNFIEGLVDISLVLEEQPDIYVYELSEGEWLQLINKL